MDIKSVIFRAFVQRMHHKHSLHLLTQNAIANIPRNRLYQPISIRTHFFVRDYFCQTEIDTVQLAQ